MNEEKKRILKMIETGKISAEEGLKLLDAIEATAEEKPAQSGTTFGKILNIRISDSQTGEVKVNLKVPLGIAHIIKSLIPESELRKMEERGINFELLFKNIDAGASGRLLEVEDIEHNQIIQINIE